MILLPELSQELVAQVSGGIFNDEVKFDLDLIESIIHQARADILRESGWKRIPDIYYQVHTPTYQSAWQDSTMCYVDFTVPDVIAVGQWSDGARYCGSPDGLAAFTRYGSGVQQAILNQHRVTKLSNQPVDVPLWNIYMNTSAGRNTLRIYNAPDIEEVIVQGIFAVPTEVSSYRREFDAYPIGEGAISTLKERANALLVQMSATPADLVSNTNPVPNQAGTPVQNRMRRRPGL